MNWIEFFFCTRIMHVYGIIIMIYLVCQFKALRQCRIGVSLVAPQRDKLTINATFLDRARWGICNNYFLVICRNTPYWNSTLSTIYNVRRCRYCNFSFKALAGWKLLRTNTIFKAGKLCLYTNVDTVVCVIY